MTKPLLSILIPTYNRKDFIVKTLENIIYQANKYKSEIEIIVSDNCSNDGAHSRLLEIEKKSNTLKYNRNLENIGFGGNMEVLLNLSSGEYIWWCGDDDIIEDGLVDKLMSVLKCRDFDNIFVNYTSNPEGIAVNLEKDFIAENLDEYFNIVKNANGFITCNVIRRCVILPMCNSLAWYHFDKLINSNTKKSYIIAKSYIQVYRPENSWYSKDNAILVATVEIVSAIMMSSLTKKAKDSLLSIYQGTIRILARSARKNCYFANYHELSRQFQFLSSKLELAQKYHEYNWEFELKILKNHRNYFILRACRNCLRSLRKLIIPR